MSSVTIVVRRQLPLVAWLATLAVAIVLLLALGGGQLATPGLTDLGAWGPWLGDREPVVAAAAILRLVVLGAAWYLVGITTVSLVAHLSRAARMVRIADALSVPVVRRVVQHAVGATMATAVLSSSVAPGLGPSAHLAGTSGAVAAGSTGTVSMQALAADEADVIAMTRVDDAPTVATMAVLDDEPVATADAAAHAGPAVPTHEVVPGDHLWSIAETTLAEAWGRAPTDDEVTPYWEEVVTANRDVLVNPDDPDLLLPGQVVTLPTPPAPPGA